MVLGVTILIFIITNVIGDPVVLLLDPTAPPSQFDLLRRELGLDKPFHIQYLVFLKNAVRGNFGQSLQYREPAMPLVLHYLPATVELTLAAMFFMVSVAIPIGVYSAIRPYSIGDRIARFLALCGQAAPPFWLGIMAILWVGVKLKLLPISGRGGLSHLILPAITLGFYGMAAILRLTRSAMLDVLEKDYIRTARIKGLTERKVVLKHAFKNALIPVVTYIALLLAALLGGAVITETIFAWPGLGRLAVQSVTARDFPVVQASVFVASIFYISINLFVDVIYTWIDPRITYK
jgi:peptide/nickel transport system permease protein